MSIRSERALQSAVHGLFHSPELGRACWKTQDVHRKGLPDCIVTADGAVAWVELKYVRERDEDRDRKFHTGLTPEQRVHLREWARARGRAYLLLAHHSDQLFLVSAMRLPPTKQRVSLNELREASLVAAPLDRPHIELALLTGLGLV